MGHHASTAASRRVTRRSGGLAVAVICLGLAPPWPVEAQSGQQPPTLDTAQRWLDESRALRKAGKYDEALKLAEQALAIREREAGPDDTKLADALHDVALILDDKHEYQKAEPLNQRALAIREKALGPDHPDVAQSLFNLAWLTKVRQDFAGAEALYRRALDIQERAFGPDHRTVSTTLNDLAILFSQTGRYDEAIATNQRVLAIRERANPPNPDGVALTLSNLARVYVNKGDYQSAAEGYRRALSIWEAALGPDHPTVANAVDGLARVATNSGDYTAAEPLFVRALAIREKTLGPDHPEVGTTLNNLGVLYVNKGDFEKAEPLFKRDVAISEARLGPNHAFVASPLGNLGLIAQRQQKYEEAARYFRRAIAINEGAYGSGHLFTALMVSRLGGLYVEDRTRDAAEAEALLQRAIATIEKAVGGNHPELGSSLSALATLREREGSDVDGERLLQRALSIREETLGPSHPDVAQSLERLAAFRQRLTDATRAIAYLTRALDIRELHLERNLPLGSDRQRVGYLRLFADDTDQAISLHARQASHASAALDLAVTTLLRRKGRALDAASDSVAILRRHAPDDQRLLFDRLAAARAQLAAVTLQGPGATNAAAYRFNLRQLEETVDRLESELSAASAAFRAESTPITRAAVQRAIPPNAALVEYARYQPRDSATGGALVPRYIAYVLTSGEAPPRWADLGEAGVIDRAVGAWRQALRNPERRDAVPLGRAVDRLVMQPVRELLLADVTHLLISPDGQLNLIPFAALADEQNRYLVERSTITYLTSGRDLLRLHAVPASRSQPVVIAAPAFGEPAIVAAEGSQPPSRPRLDTSQIFFGPLPGVGDEVRALRQLLPNATILTGEQATEAAAAQVAGPQILHVATHGFFLDAEAPGANSTEMTSTVAGTRLGRWAAAVDNPLLRSGLALAGANRGGSGSNEGILTALEASSLDLWGTRLVVLSACDTGVGDVRIGQGVYGLRRALVLAGAESQLMTLWPVSDRGTRDLMASYYRQITADVGRGEALRRAQLDLVRTPRYTHPYYWAGFIQSGAWGPVRNAEQRTKN